MKFSFLIVTFTLVLSVRSQAALIVSYDLDGPGTGVVQAGFSGKVTADNYDPRTGSIGKDGAGFDENTISGFSTGNDNVYMRTTGTTTSSLPGDGTNAYHTFGLSVSGLGVNEVLNLTNITFDYIGTGSWASNATAYFSFFSDAVGFDDFNDRLGNKTLNGNGAITTGVAIDIDLTSSNSNAGSAFTGLTNGTDLEFRIYFGDTVSGSEYSVTNVIQRIYQDLEINGTLQTIPEPSSLLLLLSAVTGLVWLRRR